MSFLLSSGYGGPDVTFESYSTSFESSFDSGWYGDARASYGRTSDQSQDGSTGLEYVGSTTNAISQQNSTIAPGAIYEGWVRWSDATGGVGIHVGSAGGDQNMGFGYGAIYEPSIGFALGGFYGSSSDVIASDSVTLSSDTWYRFELEFHGLDNYTVRCYNQSDTLQASTSGTGDYSDASGEIGFWLSSSGSGWYFDNVSLYQP